MSDMVMKSFGGFEIKDEDSGEVMAIVATLGVVDRDGDVILPGAVQQPNRVMLSSHGHDVVLGNAPPVGIGSIEEVGDRAVFKGRFFLNTTRGREAFETVKAMGSDYEWSFGFPNATVKKGELTQEWAAKGARRVLEGITPKEASPVFMPAGYGTGTVVVKSESPTDRVRAVQEAVSATNQEDSEPYRYAEAVYDDHAIVRDGERLFRVEYKQDDDGTVTLGGETEVEVQYVPVETKADEGGVEALAPEEEAEVKSAEGEMELKLAEEAAAAIRAEAEAEFDRFRRTMRRLGQVA